MKSTRPREGEPRIYRGDYYGSGKRIYSEVGGHFFQRIEILRRKLVWTIMEPTKTEIGTTNEGAIRSVNDITETNVASGKYLVDGNRTGGNRKRRDHKGEKELKRNVHSFGPE